MIRRSLLISAASLVLLPSASRAADTLNGRFTGNGQEALLRFISAYKCKGMTSKEGAVIVMTEKNHAGLKDPDADVLSGKFGSGLAISLDRPDGFMFRCHVVHQAMSRKAMVLGVVLVEAISFEGDRVKARFFTRGTAKLMDEPFEVDIQVDAAIRPRIA